MKAKAKGFILLVPGPHIWPQTVYTLNRYEPVTLDFLSFPSL